MAKFKREIHRVNFPGGVANVIPMPNVANVIPMLFQCQCYLKKLNVKTVFIAIVKFLKFDLA